MKTYMTHCQHGVFCKEVYMVTSGRLEYRPYAQAGYNKRNEWIDLVSYASTIFSYNPTTGEISFEYSTAAPNYSRTTASHVSAFCKQFCPQYTYHDIKRVYYEQG